MTKEELNEWLKSARFADIIYEDFDNDNWWQTRLYEKDGKLYSVEFLNSQPTQNIRNTFNPIEVKKVVRMVEEVTYEEIEET